MPENSRSVLCAIGGRVAILARECTPEKGVVVFRTVLLEPGQSCLLRYLVVCAVVELIITETNLVGLVNVERIDVVIEGPRV